MERRVVITGSSAITPIGYTPEEITYNLTHGVSGVNENIFNKYREGSPAGCEIWSWVIFDGVYRSGRRAILFVSIDFVAIRTRQLYI